MLRFTIRDLLWLMVIGALIACWHKERSSKDNMAEEIAAKSAELTADIAVQRAEIAAQKAANDERAHKQWTRILLEDAGIRDRERVVLERERENPLTDTNP